MKEIFIKNNEQIVRYLEEKKRKHKNVLKLTTSMYGLSVTLDYTSLHKKYIDTANQIV